MDKITEQALNDWISSQTIGILFFKSKDCGICQVQLPRIQAIAEAQEVALKVIDLSENLHLSGPQMVLNIPVTKVFFAGREVFKEGAYLDLKRLNIFLSQLKESIDER